jgi:cleavage stimulation factor subunit 3
MSTTEPGLPGDDSYSDDRTHPTAEILNNLSALNSSNNPESQQEVDPPSEYDLLTKHVADNPHDHEAWRRLVDVAEATGDTEKLSATYDALLKQFPNTVCLPTVDTPV